MVDTPAEAAEPAALAEEDRYIRAGGLSDNIHPAYAGAGNI